MKYQNVIILTNGELWIAPEQYDTIADAENGNSEFWLEDFNGEIKDIKVAHIMDKKED